MAEKSTTTSSGIGVMGLLGVVFVTLKLLGITVVANWSWWWVTAPFWGGFALVITLGLLMLLGVTVMAVLRGR